MNIIQRLEAVQLIRKNSEGSGREYEIAHDFIASAYLNYCSTNMDRNVKNALDLFMMEYIDDKRNVSFQEKISYRKEVHGQHFCRNATCLAAAFMCIAYLSQRFIFNPWTTIWSSFNPYGSYLPAFPLFISIITAIYFCCMFDKTVKYYRGGKVTFSRIIYIFLMALPSAAVFAYPHFLTLDGMAVTLASFNIIYLLDQRYRQTCRNALRAYGAKSLMVGVVITFIHIFYFFSSPNFKFGDVLIFSEFMMMTILMGYGFAVHMTQEFLFARMSDTSSEKL